MVHLFAPGLSLDRFHGRFPARASDRIPLPPITEFIRLNVKGKCAPGLLVTHDGYIQIVHLEAIHRGESELRNCKSRFGNGFLDLEFLAVQKFVGLLV